MLTLFATSHYIFGLSQEREIIDLERVEVYERIRDIKLGNNKLFLFMEDTVSIGVIDLD